ncbi:Homeodomain-like superfamily protein [Abeliophyllum distichum]|uniref:Homeodomain-like superfamily protein n=1 Tax=Abeliophyllum distichum TaxID=126358 RepID=A0ABD1UHP1_9LAMI
MANPGVLRDYRKGNWTVQETMVLIQAKKMDDERRMKKQGGISDGGKPSELRWKWVENYCWGNGCLRSRNQCNDKWDNLMRDFKKVREYEKGVLERGEDEKSYWRIDKNERKDKNLPTNMLQQIYQRLVEVVEMKGTPMVVGGGSGSNTGGGISMPSVMERLTGFGQTSPPPPPKQQPFPASTMLLPLPPSAQTPPPPPPPTLPSSRQFPAVDSDTSEHSDSPAKRRRRGGGTGGAAASGSNLQEVGSAISESASIIAQAIQSSEGREERRHIELLSLHERRLQIEESKAEIKREGINGLVDAVNKLSHSILDFASHKNQAPTK